MSEKSAECFSRTGGEERQVLPHRSLALNHTMMVCLPQMPQGGGPKALWNARSNIVHKSYQEYVEFEE
jgi:hypothetical protein